LTLAHAATWVIPGLIAAISSALATAQAIPSLTRRDTFAIARHWFMGLAAGTLAGFAVYVLLGLAEVALSILAKPVSHATSLFLDVLFTGISIAAGGAFGGWKSAKLFIPQLSSNGSPDSDAA
jgi:hypothetical protein